MIRTKEGELVTAVLMYALRCVAEGDTGALRSMQFGERELRALRKLNIADLQRIESMKAHCLSIALNHRVFWPMMELLVRQHAEEELIQELLDAEAPFDMMHHFFAMSSREYSSRRRQRETTTGVGRPALPKAKIEDALYAKWIEMVDQTEDGELDPRSYLRLHVDSGVSVRAIWQLTQRWHDYRPKTDRRRQVA